MGNVFPSTKYVHAAAFPGKYERIQVFASGAVGPEVRVPGTWLRIVKHVG